MQTTVPLKKTYNSSSLGRPKWSTGLDPPADIVQSVIINGIVNSLFAAVERIHCLLFGRGRPARRPVSASR